MLKKLSNTQKLMLGITILIIVAFYLKKKGYIGAPVIDTTKPSELDEVDATPILPDDQSQAELASETVVGAGGIAYLSTMPVACFCNGAYMGVMSHKKCADSCKPIKR